MTSASADFQFNRIDEAVADIANGRMVIVIDDEDRENEGDLVMAAQLVTPNAINFMIQKGRGLVCVPLTDDILKKFDLGEMVSRNTETHQTAFMVSVDAARSHGITTGISPSDRAKTIQVLLSPASQKSDIVTPGHVFPLRARKMGVLRRAGHTEAAVDLAGLAGLAPAGVICEIIKENGEMARTPDLITFSRENGLAIVTIKDLINYRISKERFISKIEAIPLPTAFGDFTLHCYLDTLNDREHLALTKGDIAAVDPVLVRVHSECLTGDVFHSKRCDCGSQLEAAMRMVEANGSGVILYMRQEGRGIGLANKLKAYRLQDEGADTVEANLKLGFPPDLREYGVGAQILLDLGVRNMNLITNNPTKIVGLEGYGLHVAARTPLVIPTTAHNARYMKTKSEKMGHLLDTDTEAC